ncbi:MAG: TonB-dependent receptor [Sphingomicrobium sp.]
MTTKIASARNILRMSTALTLIAFGATSAWCQVAPAGAPAPAPLANTPAGAAQLENTGEITVTAQRREEKLSRVPVSVSAFNAETLNKRVITREQDLAALVPGLIVKSGQNSNQISFTLRGQTLDPFSGTSPAVLTYINEAPFTAGNSATAFFDFSSLQVLKGPQGTLFGRNATGGAVLYETTKPGNDFGGYATVRGGSRNMFQMQGALDIPIVPGKVLVRVAGDYIRQDGYLRNAFTGHTLGDTNSKSGRVTLVLRPSDRFENITVGQYSKFGGSEGAGGLYSYHRCGETNNGFVLTATLDCVYGPNSPFAPKIGNGPPGPGTFPGATAGYLAYQQAHPFDVFLSYDLPHKAHTAFITNTTTFHLTDLLKLRNIFSYANAFARTPGILTGSPFGAIDLFNYSGLGHGPPGGETFDVRRVSEEMQLQGQSSDNRFNYIVGLFYSKSRETDYIPVVVGPELTPPLADIAYFFTNKNRSEAVYAQGTYKLTDKLSFTLGGRYTWEKVGLNQEPGALFTLPGFPTPPVQSRKLKAPSWTVNLQYQIDRSNMVYIAQRGSFRAGNFNGTVVPYGDLNFFKNETAHDVELGYKFSGSLGTVPTQFNIALYQQDVKNAQHAIYAVIGGNPAGFTVNVPKARVRGVEVDGDFHLSRLVEFGFTGAYTDARYTGNIVDLSSQTGTPGYKIPFDSYPDTPKWTGSLFAEVGLPMAPSMGKVKLRGDIFGQTKTYFSSNARSITPRTQLPGYVTADVRLSWNDIYGSKVSIAGYVKNVTDKFYYASGYVEGASGGFNTALPGQPRTFGAEASIKF